MCGIYGWVGVFSGDPPLRHDCLAHRGPDEAGTYRDALPDGVRVALGHRRLRIIDLSPEAAQPMVGERGHAIAYNGEVYNYRALRSELAARGAAFRSSGDTEVVLRAWGAWGMEALPRLNGMFAFGLWDRARRTLVLARDRAGIKPLFYARQPEGLLFASEIKALRGAPGVSDAVDPAALAHYFTLGYVPGERTIYRDIRKLAPAHALLWRDGDVSIRRYWSPPDAAATAAPVAEEEQAERLAALLGAAVERQLVADVPLGAFLSGGVDSSLVVALMRQRSAGAIKTFSIGFEGMQLYDERAHARRVAQRFETDHTEELVRPRPVDDLARIVGAFDEPFADSSAIPTYYLAAITRRSVAVALSGTGADDLFGGYRRYASSAIRRALGGLPAWARRGLARGTGRLPSGRRNRVGQAVLYLQRATAADVDPAAWYASLMTVLDRDLLRALAPDVPEARHPLAALLAHGARRPDVERYLWTDFHTYLPDDLLVKEDRMTMAHGLEARVPFLDHEVMDFAWTLPAGARVRGLRTKALLKRVAARWLPADIVDRPKHGFAVPVGEWLRGELRDVAAAALLDGDGGVLDRAAVRALWDRHQAGRDLGTQLWALLVYRLWERDRAAGAAPVLAAAAACR